MRLRLRQRAIFDKSTDLIDKGADLIDGRVRLATVDLGADLIKLVKQRIGLTLCQRACCYQRVYPSSNGTYLVWIGFASKVGTRAPTARNMTARGKREAKRSASPLVTDNQMFQP